MSYPCPNSGCPTVAESEPGLKRHLNACKFAPKEAAPAAQPEATNRSKVAGVGEMVIDSRKRIKTIQDEFSACFPYLGLHFFSVDEMAKSKTGGKIVPFGGDEKLASVRAPGTSGNGDFNLSGRMHVGTLEADIRKCFGLLVQVCVQKDGKGFYTSGEQDAQSLARLNESCESGGYDRFSYAAFRK